MSHSGLRWYFKGLLLVQSFKAISLAQRRVGIKKTHRRLAVRFRVKGCAAWDQTASKLDLSAPHSGQTQSPWAGFAGGTLALTAVTALGVIGGEGLARLVPERLLLWLSAAAFIVMGLLMALGIL